MAIGSNKQGYFHIQDSPELDRQIKRLRQQINAIQNRIDKTVAAYFVERNRDVLENVEGKKNKCRMLVGLIAENRKIPFQTVYTLAYQRLENAVNFCVTKTPPGWSKSIIDYVEACGLLDRLLNTLEDMQTTF
jgi:hypothetical protein